MNKPSIGRQKKSWENKKSAHTVNINININSLLNSVCGVRHVHVLCLTLGSPILIHCHLLQSHQFRALTMYWHWGGHTTAVDNIWNHFWTHLFFLLSTPFLIHILKSFQPFFFVLTEQGARALTADRCETTYAHVIGSNEMRKLLLNI